MRPCTFGEVRREQQPLGQARPHEEPKESPVNALIRKAAGRG
jgi:hypothetical protein